MGDSRSGEDPSCQGWPKTPWGARHERVLITDLDRTHSIVVSSGTGLVGGICGPEQRCLTVLLANFLSSTKETDETSHPTGTAYRE
jgi:hypothetical protein